jgi:tetratricopeptide (TPR) repeat protein
MDDELVDIATERHRDPRARLVAICAVLVTVAAAAAGYLQSEALKDSAAAEVDAQQLSAAALAESDRSWEQRFLQLELFMRQQVNRRNAALAFELRRFSSAPDGELRRLQGTSMQLAEVGSRRARRIADSDIGEIAPISVRGPEGPDRDPLFPTRFLYGNGGQGLALIAESDAAIEYAKVRGNAVSTYIAIIAIFAVAVYLFGFSLTPHGRTNRPLLATAATVLALAGIVWGGTTLLSSPTRAGDSAADAYARAESEQLVGEFDESVEDYGEAIEGGADFPRAYRQRAIARFWADSPQAREAYGVNLTSPSALRGSISDLERAEDLGLKDSTVVGDLSFSYLNLGIQERDPELIAEAVDLGERLAELLPGKSVYGMAVGELALGHRARALELLKLGALQIAFANVSKRKPRPYDEQTQELGSAMTDLELLAAHYPDLAGEVLSAKEQLVRIVQEAAGGSSGGEGEKADAGFRASGMSGYVWPGGVGFSVSARGFDPHRDRTWVEWYRKENDLGWFAMSAASGPPSVGRADLDSLSWEWGYRRTWLLNSYYLRDTRQPVCLPPGTYRVELYVNGRLAGTRQLGSDFGSLEPAVDRMVGYRLCRPAGWRPSPEARPGLLNGFISPGRTRGVYVIRLSNAAGLGSVFGQGSQVRAAVGPILREFGGLLPARPEHGRDVNLAFLGKDDEVMRDYTYRGGRLRIGVSRQLDGSLFIGFVFWSKRGWRASNCAPCDIMAAITESA